MAGVRGSSITYLSSHLHLVPCCHKKRSGHRGDQLSLIVWDILGIEKQGCPCPLLKDQDASFPYFLNFLKPQYFGTHDYV